jgi:hypothetical protein
MPEIDAESSVWGNHFVRSLIAKSAYAFLPPSTGKCSLFQLASYPDAQLPCLPLTIVHHSPGVCFAHRHQKTPEAG